MHTRHHQWKEGELGDLSEFMRPENGAYDLTLVVVSPPLRRSCRATRNPNTCAAPDLSLQSVKTNQQDYLTSVQGLVIVALTTLYEAARPGCHEN